MRWWWEGRKEGQASSPFICLKPALPRARWRSKSSRNLVPPCSPAARPHRVWRKGVCPAVVWFTHELLGVSRASRAVARRASACEAVELALPAGRSSRASSRDGLQLKDVVSRALPVASLRSYRRVNRLLVRSAARDGSCASAGRRRLKRSGAERG